MMQPTVEHTVQNVVLGRGFRVYLYCSCKHLGCVVDHGYISTVECGQIQHRDMSTDVADIRRVRHVEQSVHPNAAHS